MWGSRLRGIWLDGELSSLDSSLGMGQDPRSMSKCQPSERCLNQNCASRQAKKTIVSILSFQRKCLTCHSNILQSTSAAALFNTFACGANKSSKKHAFARKAKNMSKKSLASAQLHSNVGWQTCYVLQAYSTCLWKIRGSVSGLPLNLPGFGRSIPFNLSI